MSDKDAQSRDLHVDAGWKERARREKESLERPGQPAEAAESGVDAGQGGPQTPAGAGEDRGFLPPPTFLTLVVGIATQISIGLGITENPVTGKRETDIEAARHAIDMLDMLKAKTKGNLDEAEAGCLDDLLYGLRMEYVRRVGK